MNRFTPGPYSVHPATAGKPTWHIKDTEGHTLASVYANKANADLFCEAPDMAAALEKAKVALETVLIHAERAWDRAHADDIAKSIDLVRQTATSARDDAAAVLVNATGEG